MLVADAVAMMMMLLLYDGYRILGVTSESHVSLQCVRVLEITATSTACIPVFTCTKIKQTNRKTNISNANYNTNIS